METYKQGDICKVKEGRSIRLKNIYGGVAQKLLAPDLIVVLGYRGLHDRQKNPPYLVTTPDSPSNHSWYVTHNALRAKTELLMNEDIIYTTKGIFAYESISEPENDTILPTVDGFFYSYDLQGPRFESVKQAQIQLGSGKIYPGVFDSSKSFMHCTVEYFRRENGYAEVVKITGE